MLDESVKAQMLKSAEKLTEAALTEAVALAEVYAASTEHSQIDDQVVNGIKMLKSAFLDGLVNKIDGQEG